MIDDVVGGCEHAVGEPVVAQELPGVFGRVQLGRFRRQQHDADIVGHAELIGGVPSGLIDEQDGMGVVSDRLGYLGEVQVHRRDVAERKDQPRRLALRRADRTEDIGRLGPLIVRGDRPRAAQCPAPGDLVLLADPGLVPEPDLYLLTRRLVARDLRHNGGELFLKTAAASGVWAWCRGRAESLRYPISFRTRPMVVWQTTIRNSSQIHWTKSTSRQRTTPWTAGIGPSSTIRARARRCSALSKGGWPGAFLSIRPVGPSALNRMTQSRTI